MSGTLTPNFRLLKPPFDDIPWDEAVNGNMDIIDTALAQYLTIANFAGVWKNSTAYGTGQVLIDAQDSTMWQCVVAHTSAATPTLFSEDRANRPTLWSQAAGTVSPTATNAANIGRNLIHNPLFNIQQRGGGPFTSSNATTLDRWLMSFVGDTLAVSRLTLNDTDRTQISDEAAQQAIVVVVTGTAGAGAFSILRQAIEGVTRLSGKMITVSFWARTASGTLKLGASVDENFGTGGSPSAAVQGVGQQVTLSPTWARYSLTFTLPSASGKTFGTAGDNRTEAVFWFSSGANMATRAGNIGVQSGTLAIWGVQLEIGSIATPLEKPDPRYDLSNCQRMFCLVPVYSLLAATVVNQYLSTTGTCPVTMRAVPTLTPVSTIAIDQNLNAFTVDLPTVGGFRAYATSNAAGASAFSRLISCSADL